eukprot:TRINITY_DN2963_c0_g3_i1.p1 TRINITY_DN2963_c0_g3~~TRINITY_DN2963_c0_g3_i1.p1  ORF type:complete len:224 (+),score=28.47 TRINITY_DN2963_c0_g3_i1:84-755(+)
MSWLLKVAGYGISTISLLGAARLAVYNFQASRAKAASYETLSQLSVAPLRVEGQSVIEEPAVALSSVWKDSGAVIFVARRPGCLLCREEAQDLEKLIPRLHAEGIQPRFIAVVHEKLGVPEFKPFFPSGEIYYDGNRDVFRALGDLYMGAWGFLSPSVWKNVMRAKQNKVAGNTEGEGRYLGGLLVLGPNDQGIIFEHKEKTWGDHAYLEDVMNACRKIKKSQ